MSALRRDVRVEGVSVRCPPTPTCVRASVHVCGTRNLRSAARARACFVSLYVCVLTSVEFYAGRISTDRHRGLVDYP
eukprot:COSAG02_NODE_348_length_24081_cov_19.231007_16_plen_77_part_00